MRHVLVLLVVLAGCDPGDDPQDGGSCTLEVALGAIEAGTFTPVRDGDPAELILGFQGFRMLSFAMDVRGAGEARELEVSAFVSIAETGVELSQRTRESQLTRTGEGVRLAQWLVFFHDEPPSRVVDREAQIELIVRAAGCTGGTRVRVMVRDEDPCVDPSIVLDAGGLDAGTIDAGTCL